MRIVRPAAGVLIVTDGAACSSTQAAAASSSARPMIDDMGWFNRDAAEDGQMPAQLTAEDRATLARLERQVDAGIAYVDAMIGAGKALATIRDRQLYREAASTWEAYVDTRFRMSKRRADQMIAFAGVSEALSEMGTAVPKLSERAVRPLVGLDQEQLKAVVAEAAEGGELTPASIRKAASRRKGKAKAAKAPRPRRFKVPGATVQITFNRKSNGSVLEALEAAMRQAEALIEAQSDAA